MITPLPLKDKEVESPSSLYNYIISIKGFWYDGKRMLIHRVSIIDKTYKMILLNFFDIVHDIKTPKSFVRLIDNTQYVYENGERVLSQKRKKFHILPRFQYV